MPNDDNTLLDIKDALPDGPALLGTLHAFGGIDSTVPNPRRPDSPHKRFFYIE